MQNPSIFTRIINGEIPSFKIYEDNRVIAILTNHPLSEGHTLIIPKKEIDQIWDMSQNDYAYLWQVTHKIALHIREALNCIRVGIVVKGFEVPHVHIHVVPVPNTGVRVNFDPEQDPPLASDEELAKVAEKLRFPDVN